MLTMSIMFDASIEPFSVLSFRQSIRCFHALLTLPTSFIGRSTVCQSVQPNSWICSSEQSQNVGFFWILILASTTPRLFLFNRGLPMTCLTQNMLLPTRLQKKYQVYIKSLSVSVLARKVTFRYAWRIENVPYRLTGRRSRHVLRYFLFVPPFLWRAQNSYRREARLDEKNGVQLFTPERYKRHISGIHHLR